MANSKMIYIIYANDAPEHLGNLKQILEHLKQDGRITDSTEIMTDTFDENSLHAVSGEDMILFMLTDGVSGIKNSIELTLLNLKQKHPGTTIVEIIVDNLTYEMEFIAFPSDLQPIRECQDMDAAWQGIEANLREMLPGGKRWWDGPAWKKYAPYIIGAILVAVLAYFILPSLTGGKAHADFSYRVLDPVKNDVIANATGCYIPCKVFLSDRSENAETLQWTLGDTTVTDLKEPYYVFKKPGVYNLSLTAAHGNQKHEKTSELEVKAPPFANFEIINNGCTAPCEVTFKNTSQNASTFNWTFQGTATAASTSENPEKQTFSDPGTFEVTLNVANNDSIKADMKQVVTILRDNAPFADFIYKKISGSGTPTQTYHFISTSKNANSYRWEVEGTNTIYKTADFDYTFNGYKTYSVKLTVMGDNNQEANTFKNIAVNKYIFGINNEYLKKIGTVRYDRVLSN